LRCSRADAEAGSILATPLIVAPIVTTAALATPISTIAIVSTIATCRTAAIASVLPRTLLLLAPAVALITALAISILMMPAPLLAMATLALAAARILTLRRRRCLGAPRRPRTLTTRLATWPTILSVASPRPPDLDHWHIGDRGFGFVIGAGLGTCLRCVVGLGLGRFGLGRRGRIGRIGRIGRRHLGCGNSLRSRACLRLRCGIGANFVNGRRIGSFGRSLSGRCGRLRCSLDRLLNAFR
jgi:hypothetical protein